MAEPRSSTPSGVPEITVICPVTRESQDVAAVHREFGDELAKTDRRIEFLYVLDGRHTGAEESIDRIRETRFPVRVCRMAKGFGEATALQYGFEHAHGRLCLTIADRPQIDATVVHEILRRLDAGVKFVVTRRRRRDNVFNRLQSRVFHWLVQRLTWQSFHDMTCGVRGMTREAGRRLDLYGDQHRFIPVLAARCGYRAEEIEADQHADNRSLRLYGPGVYARRLLDILSIFFLLRFTRKPLRFFGLFGSTIGLIGFVVTAMLAAQRLFGDIALADRPLLILGVLLIVLGVQVVSIGLLGEIIIFLSSRREIPDATEIRIAEPDSTSRDG